MIYSRDGDCMVYICGNCGKEIRRTPSYCPKCKASIKDDHVEWNPEKINHFKCPTCGEEVEAEEEQAKLPGVKCPYCSYRILYEP